jgi:hypothetical protein
MTIVENLLFQALLNWLTTEVIVAIYVVTSAVANLYTLDLLSRCNALFKLVACFQ